MGCDVLVVQYCVLYCEQYCCCQDTNLSSLSLIWHLSSFFSLLLCMHIHIHIIGRNLQSYCHSSRNQGDSIKDGSFEVLVVGGSTTVQSSWLDFGKIWDIASNSSSLFASKYDSKERSWRKKEIVKPNIYYLNLQIKWIEIMWICKESTKSL